MNSILRFFRCAHARFIAQRLPRGRLLNAFGCGGYASFATANKVFIDGRTHVAGPAFYEEYLRSCQPDHLAGLLSKWKPDMALISIANDTPWLLHLMGRSDWRRVHTDEQDAVWAREGFAPEVPPISPPLARRDYPVFSENELDAILARTIGMRRPGFTDTIMGAHVYPLDELRWCGLYLLRGYPEAALGHGLAGLRKSTLPAPDLLNNVMMALLAMGDTTRACLCFSALPPVFQDTRLEQTLFCPASPQQSGPFGTIRTKPQFIKCRIQGKVWPRCHL